MTTAINSDFKNLVRERTDIVQLIGETVELRPIQGGRLFQGVCPLHAGSHLKLKVNHERQSFKCWMCDEGGDCFAFVMKTRGLSFREAIRWLAERAGISQELIARNEAMHS